MPLTELMHYFNDQLQIQARRLRLPATGFYKAGKAYGARFGSLTFTSRFYPINHPGQESISGFYSQLQVRSVTGKQFSADEVFQSLENTGQLVHLDRLTRTLHSLNYLQQYDNRDLLALAVQPGHITGVAGDHGKTFEGILSDCGLGPDRVLLHTRLVDEASLAHFRQALLNYRSRGYHIDITLEKSEEVTLLEQLSLEPDVIFYRLPEANLIARAGRKNDRESTLSKRILIGDVQDLENNRSGEFDGIVIAEQRIESPKLCAPSL